MTNEELVVLIQQGQIHRISELWEQIQGLAKYWANRYMRSVVVSGRDTNNSELFDDFFQCGYIAMVAAVDSFNSSAGGSFSTWYSYYFRQEVYSLMGWRSVRDPSTGEYVTIRKDAMGHADSLDAPLDDESDGGSLCDIIPDPDGLSGFEETHERIWNQELHAALENALSTLPEEQSRTLRRRFYEGKTLAALAAEDGVCQEEIRRRECKGLRKIRRSKAIRQLRPFIHPDDVYAAGTQGNGVGAFRRTGMSSTERIVIAMDEGKQI